MPTGAPVVHRGKPAGAQFQRSVTKRSVRSAPARNKQVTNQLHSNLGLRLGARNGPRVQWQASGDQTQRSCHQAQCALRPYTGASKSHKLQAAV